MELSANLPADDLATPVTTQAQIYDTLGRQHTMDLTFTPAGGSTWTLAVSVADDVVSPARGTLSLQFGSAGSPVEPDGTISGMTTPTGSIAVTGSNAAGNAATFSFDADFGQGAQTVTLGLGSFGSSSGLTQYAGTAFSLNNLTQDGVPLGAYSGLAIRDNGDVAVNYDNGQSHVVARIPIAAFNTPDQLQRLDGQGFQATLSSGAARIVQVNADGVGKLVVGSLEGSNVDTANEFSKLIVAQRAYSANTKIVTTADQLLQDTINMAR
jgi:flagellar hook protein FlgE